MVFWRKNVSVWDVVIVILIAYIIIKSKIYIWFQTLKKLPLKYWLSFT